MFLEVVLLSEEDVKKLVDAISKEAFKGEERC